MAEWLAERGIGETRYVRVIDGEIVEARILPDGQARHGTVVAARLISRGAAGKNAVAADPDGREYLLPLGAAGVAEGSLLSIEIDRETIPGVEPWKRPLARLSDKPAANTSPPTADPLPFSSPDDRLGGHGWNDLLDEARSGSVRFAAGELTIEPTRAMTMIDVDGLGEAHELALLGAAAAARAILRLDIQGSIGIDLPTATGKVARQRSAEAIDAILPQPFERTAVNGFGFLQIVRPRRRASIVELAADRPAFECRALLRAAAFGHGGCTVTVHPRIAALLERQPVWLAELSRRRGGEARLHVDPNLTISAWHVDQA